MATTTASTATSTTYTGSFTHSNAVGTFTTDATPPHGRLKCIRWKNGDLPYHQPFSRFPASEADRYVLRGEADYCSKAEFRLYTGTLQPRDRTTLKGRPIQNGRRENCIRQIKLGLPRHARMELIGIGLSIIEKNRIVDALMEEIKQR